MDSRIIFSLVVKSDMLFSSIVEILDVDSVLSRVLASRAALRLDLELKRRAASRQKS